VVKEGTQLGGVGGGSILHQDEDAKKVWPWDMPLNDKTFVQLQRASGEEGDQATRKVAGGTLYSHVRDIEVAGAKPPKLTSFGELRPVGNAGRHQYEFQFPRDSEQHERMAFVPSAAGRPRTQTHTHTHMLQFLFIYSCAHQLSGGRRVGKSSEPHPSACHAQAAPRKDPRRPTSSLRLSTRIHQALATAR
jgi:hypothetical protein